MSDSSGNETEHYVKNIKCKLPFLRCCFDAEPML